MPYCYYCKKEIWFSDEPEFVSSNGKKIPLTKFNGEFHKHRCPENPYNKDTRRAYYYGQQDKTEEEKLAEEQELKERHRKWKEEQAQHQDARAKYNDKERYDIPVELDSILRDKRTAKDGKIISELIYLIYGPCEDLDHSGFLSLEKKIYRILTQIRNEAIQKYDEEGIIPDFLPYAGQVKGEGLVWKYYNRVADIENVVKLHKIRAEGLEHRANKLRDIYGIEEEE